MKKDSIEYRVLLRRISDKNIRWDTLMDEIVKSGVNHEEILVAFENRILNTDYVYIWGLLDYIKEFDRQDFFQAARKKIPLSLRETAQFFELGYFEMEDEAYLCNKLGVMARTWNQMQDFMDCCAIMRALGNFGGSRSLESLQVFKYETEPEIKTSLLLLRNMQELIKENLDQSVSTQLSEGQIDVIMKGKTASVLMDYCEEAIEKLVARGVELPNVAVGSYLNIEENTARGLSAENSGAVDEKELRMQDYIYKFNLFSADHPAMALNNARKFVEALCKALLDRKAQADGKSPPSGIKDLEKLIELVRKQYDVNESTKLHFETIQKFGNLGSHDQENESEESFRNAAIILKVPIEELMKWYRTNNF
jgi:hypothetical protein